MPTELLYANLAPPTRHLNTQECYSISNPTFIEVGCRKLSFIKVKVWFGHFNLPTVRIYVHSMTRPVGISCLACTGGLVRLLTLNHRIFMLLPSILPFISEVVVREIQPSMMRRYRQVESISFFTHTPTKRWRCMFSWKQTIAFWSLRPYPSNGKGSALWYIFTTRKD